MTEIQIFGISLFTLGITAITITIMILKHENNPTSDHTDLEVKAGTIGFVGVVCVITGALINLISGALAFTGG